MKAIRKPTELDAWQIPHETNLSDWVDETLPDNISDKITVYKIFSTGPNNGKYVLTLHMLSGHKEARPGDYIVQGNHDDVWIVQKDIFEDHYDELEAGKNR